MPNNETMSYVVSMLRQINQTTSVLSQNQNLLFEQFKTLEQKVDSNYIKLDEKINQLDKKFDDKIDKLDQKIDKLEQKVNSNYIKLDQKIERNTTMVLELQKTVLSMQKEIKDMHEDITTIYTLETDSRKKLQKIM